MIPTQDRADMTDPGQHAAWLFIALRMRSGDTLNFHPYDAEAASTQLWEAGFRHHPELQTHRQSVPGGPQAQFLAAAGADWVPVDAPESPVERARREVPDISGLSLAQRTALQEQLTALGHGAHRDVPPEFEAATVSRAAMPGDRFADGDKVREVVEPAGEWVKVVNPETGRRGRMKKASLDRWEAL